MKKFLLGIVLVMLVMTSVLAKKSVKKQECTSIQSGELYELTGEQLTTGFNQHGYNYQAHKYIKEFGSYKIMLKWNDVYLSNKDCDGDGFLDRHYGFDSYIGSGAWWTEHWTGTDWNGCNWNHFLKIVAVPTDAYIQGYYWYTSDGEEIGPALGEFAITQNVYNYPCYGYNGIYYKSPFSPGFGPYKP